MSGYSGYSKSNNAVQAESEGRVPMTRAARAVAKAAGLTVAEAKNLLKSTWGGEFHHTSKRYNRTPYHDVAEAIRIHKLSVGAAALPAGWRAPMGDVRRERVGDARSLDQRSAEIDAADRAYAAALGVDCDRLIDMYYGG